MWEAIIYPCFDSNGSLTTTALMFGHVWIITIHRCIWTFSLLKRLLVYRLTMILFLSKLYVRFFSGNITMHVYFLSLLDTETVHVTKITPHERQWSMYDTQSIPCLLLIQDNIIRCHCHSSSGIFLAQHQKGQFKHKRLFYVYCLFIIS